MTIEQLGSIGELVAALATVVTLAYLALQIRGSTVATKAEAGGLFVPTAPRRFA